MYYEIGRLAIGLICHESVMYLLYDIDTICRTAGLELHLLITLDTCLCVITQSRLVGDIEIA